MKKMKLKQNLLTAIVWLVAFSALGQNPKVERQDVDNCIITKIEKSTYATTVHFKYTSDPKYTDGGWACVGKDFFIEDANTGKRFKMLKANNIPICPEKHQFAAGNQELDFTVDFEPINQTDKINVIENELESAFNFFGVEVPQTTPTFFTLKSTTVYLIVALIMTLLMNLFLRKRFNWWTLLLITAIPNFLIGVLAIFIIATLQYEKVFLNFNEQNLAAQFGESLGNTLIAFILIAPFFRRKKQNANSNNTNPTKQENRLNPLNQFKKLPQGSYRLIVAGWIIIPLLASAIAAGISRDSNDAFLATLIFSIPIYYLLARLGAWVVLGFKNDKPPQTTTLNAQPEDSQEILQSQTTEAEIVKSENDIKPKSFYLSIILMIFLFISTAFIIVLFDQISNYRIANDESNEKIRTLNDEIKYEQTKYQIHSLVGSKTESEECSLDFELTVENKLDFPIRLYISRPIKNSLTIQWEQFSDTFWLLEPGYNGQLTLDDKTLTVSGYRYYITDTDGNFIIGSPKRPVYTSIVDNILQGLKIY